MSIEGPGAPEPAPRAEKKPAKAEQETGKETEDAVALLHRHHDGITHGSESPDEQFLAELRADVSRLEFYPMYQEYLADRVPTIPMLEESMKRAVASLDALLAGWKSHGVVAEEMAEETKMRNLLSGRLAAIRGDIFDYIHTMIRFHNIKRKWKDPRFEGDPDVQEQFEKIDADRRRAHESLLLALSIMTSTVLKAAEEDLLEGHTIVEWTPGMPAGPLVKNPSAIVVFSPAFFGSRDQTQAKRNRDYLRDWAIAADFDEQFREIAEVQRSGQSPK